MDEPARKPQPHIEIGHRIAERRRQLGREQGKRITQKQVADAVGVATGTVTAWEIGKQRPEGESLVKLAAFLETTPDQIIAGQPSGGNVPLRTPDTSALPERVRRRLNEFMGELFDADCGQDIMEQTRRGVLTALGAAPEALQLDMLEAILPIARRIAGVPPKPGPSSEPDSEEDPTASTSSDHGAKFQERADLAKQQREQRRSG